MKTKTKTSVLLLSLALLGSPAGASDFSLAWSTFDGGGGLSTSADGRFLLAGSAGQPDAGHASQGRYSLEGGFWNSVLCAYGLTISRVDIANSMPPVSRIVVSWPADGQEHTVLEAATELHSNPWLNVWTPVAFRREGDLYLHEAPANMQARYYRLRSPGPAIP